MSAGGHELGSFLAHMVETGQTGFGREATGVTDDWSRTVDELMTVTYAAVFNYAAGFSGPRKRGHNAVAFAAPDHFPSPGWLLGLAGPADAAPPSGGHANHSDDGAEGGALSVLRIGIARQDDWMD